MRLALDVGANIGQTAARLKVEGYDPIHCFEPVEAAYRKLVAAHPDVHAHRLALGDENGEARMRVSGHSTMNRIDAHGTERVTVIRGDDWCAEHDVEKVALLKVDAEGWDLRVLHGFRLMLQEGRIRRVRVEAGMHLGNATHVYVREFLDHLEPLGYALEAIDDMQPEGNGIMRRADLTFLLT